MKCGRVCRIVLVLLGTAIAIEVAFRLCGGLLGVDREALTSYRRLVCDGESSQFEARAHTTYVRNRERPDTNSFGFAGGEWIEPKRPGVPRIACIGGSTTEGSYPQHLAEVLRQRTGKEFEVMNAGLSGWTTAESLVNWFLLLRDFHPDVVVLHHAVNDVPPRLRSGHRPDYSHYRKILAPRSRSALERVLVRWSDLYAWALVRRGVPSIGDLTTRSLTDRLDGEDSPLPYPEGVATYRRNLATIGRDVVLDGGRVVLVTMPVRPEQPEDVAFDFLLRQGTLEHNQVARELAAEQRWTLVDAERAFAEHSGSEDWFVDLVHLDQVGQLFLTDLVADDLEALSRE